MSEETDSSIPSNVAGVDVAGVDVAGGPSSAVRLESVADTEAWGRHLASLLRAGDLVLLSGALGAGKTALTRGIGAGLGVRGAVTSPTFVIARVHPSMGDGPSLVHVDAYRLSDLTEVDDLDLDASVADSVTVVEWGEGKVELLAADRLEITLTRSSLVGAASDDAVGRAREETSDPRLADHENSEPRVATVRGVGARWSGVVL